MGKRPECPSLKIKTGRKLHIEGPATRTCSFHVYFFPKISSVIFELPGIRSATRSHRAPHWNFSPCPEKLSFDPVGLKFGRDHCPTRFFALIDIPASNFPKRVWKTRYVSTLYSRGILVILPGVTISPPWDHSSSNEGSR